MRRRSARLRRAGTASASVAPLSIAKLPEELLTHIFSHLRCPKANVCVLLVCKGWRAHVTPIDEQLWYLASEDRWPKLARMLRDAGKISSWRAFFKQQDNVPSPEIRSPSYFDFDQLYWNPAGIGEAMLAAHGDVGALVLADQLLLAVALEVEYSHAGKVAHGLDGILAARAPTVSLLLRSLLQLGERLGWKSAIRFAFY